MKARNRFRAFIFISPGRKNSCKNQRSFNTDETSHDWVTSPWLFFCTKITAKSLPFEGEAILNHYEVSDESTGRSFK